MGQASCLPEHIRNVQDAHSTKHPACLKIEIEGTGKMPIPQTQIQIQIQIQIQTQI